MKSMKLIMENFRKTMKEAWPGTEEPKASWTGKPNHDWSAEIDRNKAFRQSEDMKAGVASIVRDEIVAMFDNKHSSVTDIVDDPNTKLDTHTLKAHIKRHWGDAVASFTGDVAPPLSEDDYNEIINLMDTFGKEEEEGLESDVRDNPGYAVGQGANWK